jgi:hypothetical protein
MNQQIEELQHQLVHLQRQVAERTWTILLCSTVYVVCW